ncbi:3-dehydroquinate synthase [Putridiphycobacter roseus]|uniref:3-dehydroquinate synthase n=1 Tax=Putridiphycobacter roseus TaxID=2219161 RepID=A0A2W1NLQ4_9FLAO|nr:3-dehydroquinate synthase [Putridiphycobacter roseus]PZE15658.1 3-dehydroquinate synthase [Putridiphycobacter roseus]
MITEIEEYKKSKVVVGEKLQKLNSYIPQTAQSVILITDENVGALYSDLFPDYPVITIGTGEKIKTQETVDFIAESMLNLGADRHTFLVGIGGGVVCDITGFVASIYMRGIDFGYVPTTLLSQVDASVGGKTGINFKGFKNIIGVFSQPQFVLCDVNLLVSLPEEEVKSGLIEIVKHSIINDPTKFGFIRSNINKILAIDIPTLEYLIIQSVRIKIKVVTEDEKEKGERKKLNLGHTIGHAIESISGISHGFAVAIGLVLTARISHLSGFCSQETVDEITMLISSLQMATTSDIGLSELIQAIQKDKKKSLDTVDFIAIKSIGEVFIHPITFRELEKNIKAVR